MWTEAGGNKPHVIDDALVRRVTKVWSSYSADNIKTAIDKIHKARNDNDNYYNASPSLFEFMVESKISNWLHADLGNMKPFASSKDNKNDKRTERGNTGEFKSIAQIVREGEQNNV